MTRTIRLVYREELSIRWRRYGRLHLQVPSVRWSQQQVLGSTAWVACGLRDERACRYPAAYPRAASSTRPRATTADTRAPRSAVWRSQALGPAPPYEGVRLIICNEIATRSIDSVEAATEVLGAVPAIRRSGQGEEVRRG